MGSSVSPMVANLQPLTESLLSPLGPLLQVIGLETWMIPGLK